MASDSLSCHFADAVRLKIATQFLQRHQARLSGKEETGVYHWMDRPDYRSGRKGQGVIISHLKKPLYAPKDPRGNPKLPLGDHRFLREYLGCGGHALRVADQSSP